MGNVDVETTGADIVKALGGNAGGKISIMLVVPTIRLALTFDASPHHWSEQIRHRR